MVIRHDGDVDLIWWVSGSVLVGLGCLYRRCLGDDGVVGLGWVWFGFEFGLRGGQNMHNVGVLFFFFVVLLDFLPRLLGKLVNDGGFFCLGYWVTMVGSVVDCVMGNNGSLW